MDGHNRRRWHKIKVFRACLVQPGHCYRTISSPVRRDGATVRTCAHAVAAAARAARGVLVRGRSLNSGDCHALWRVMGTGARRGQRTASVRGEAGRKKTDKVGSKVLRALWAEQLRKRGHIIPTRVPALARLRPRGCTYPVDPGMVLGDGQQLAIDVCEAVERHVFSLFVFSSADHLSFCNSGCRWVQCAVTL